MIGVHLRRGNFLRSQAGSVANTAQAIAEVVRQLEQAPNAGILLCSNDGAVDPTTGKPWSEGVREEFARQFKERVVSTHPRTVDRRQPEAVQDALVDFLLLRQTGALIGMLRSTFSEMAAFGRLIPKVFCRSSEGYASRIGTLRRLMNAIGLYSLYAQAVYRHYGKLVPSRALLYHFLYRRQRWLRGLLEGRLPGLYHWIRVRRKVP